jgi:hypothetical protein
VKTSIIIAILAEVEAAEQKGNKLWLFGWACAARLGWDLNALLKW